MTEVLAELGYQPTIVGAEALQEQNGRVGQFLGRVATGLRDIGSRMDRIAMSVLTLGAPAAGGVAVVGAAEVFAGVQPAAAEAAAVMAAPVGDGLSLSVECQSDRAVINTNNTSPNLYQADYVLEEASTAAVLSKKEVYLPMGQTQEPIYLFGTETARSGNKVYPEIKFSGNLYSHESTFYNPPVKLESSAVEINCPDTSTAEGGYNTFAADGATGSFGNAKNFGSLEGQPLTKPIVGGTTTPTGEGYWLVGADGGIFAFGDAKFFGSTGSERLNKPIRAMDATPSGKGYRFIAGDGGIFAFGDAGFYGRPPQTSSTQVAIDSTPQPQQLHVVR